MYIIVIMVVTLGSLTLRNVRLLMFLGIGRSRNWSYLDR